MIVMDDIEKVAEAIVNLSYTIADVVIPAFKRIVDIVADYTNEVLNNPSNRRVKHLAFNAKKARVRKKNLNRITKQVQRNMKRMVNKNEDT